MRRFGLKGRIILPSIILFFLFLALLVGIIHYIGQRTIRNFIEDDIQAKQQDMYQGITMVLDEVSLLYSRIVLHPEFEALMVEPMEESERQERFHDMVWEVGINEELFSDIVLHFDEDTVRFNDTAAHGPLPPLAIEEISHSERLLEHFGVYEDAKAKPHLLLGKRVRLPPSPVEEASMFFYLREETFRTFYDTIDDELGHSFILEEDETVISHTRGEFVGATFLDIAFLTDGELPSHTVRTINGERSIIIVNESITLHSQYGLDWKVASILSYDTLYADILLLNRYNTLMGVAGVFLAIVISWQIATRITGPINNIIKNLRAFSEKGERRPVSKHAKDELRELEETYDRMIEQITDLIETNRKKAENERKLELYTLQMQINPHFLYNTLDTIAWMAKIKKQADIEHLVIALAKFFRISLHKGDKYVKVEEEIELIKNFIEIELARFPDKFTVEYDVDESIRHEKTLKLILQPIVENAIKHGISRLERKGHLTVCAKDAGDDIVFEVADDGVGFEPSAAHFQKDDEETMSGYGMKNVDDRIRLEYGDGYGIRVHSRPHGGTRVVLRIKKARSLNRALD